MKKIIINADDFGLTSRINEAVVMAHKDGVLTSATVMANGLALGEAMEIAKAYPSLGVGIHLNLTVLKPISKGELVPSLINSKGLLYKDFWKLPFKKIREVETEWEAQISKVLSLGLKPTHIDSHHHVHLFPPFTKVAIGLAQKYKIPCVRLISPASLELMEVGLLTKAFVKKSWRYEQRIDRPCTVIGIENYTPEKIANTIGKIHPGVHEFFLHPGFKDDPQLVGVSSLTQQRQKDYNLLIDPVIKDTFNMKGIKLVNYSIFH